MKKYISSFITRSGTLRDDGHPDAKPLRHDGLLSIRGKNRSKYQPHVGMKQKVKALKRDKNELALNY